MTAVDVDFYGTHQFQHHLSFDIMPEEDEVRSIAGPFVTSQTVDGDDDFISAQDGIFHQDRGLHDGLFDDVAPEVSDVKNIFSERAGLQSDKHSVNPTLKSHHEDDKLPTSDSCKAARPSQPVVRVQSNSIPVSYEVRGLQQHEMPVIGVYVDRRIMPGFRYRARIVPTISGSSINATPDSRYQFNGRALHLLSIGQGYGKRLTFTRESLNNNGNYFWSDSNPAGYAFSIVAVQAGDEMVLTDLSRRPIGRGTVEEASPCQMELGTETLKDEGSNRNTFTKRVSVIMKVRLRYTCERHGIRSIRADETVIVRGVAKVVKAAGESLAYTKCIEEIELPNLGECLLYMS